MLEKYKKTPRLLLIPLILLLYVHIHAETVVEQYSGTPQTIAHDFLDIEKPFGTNSANYVYINKLINKAIKRIILKNDYTTEEAVKTLKDIYTLLKEEGFVFKPNFLISTGIDKKEIDCDTYTALYTAIAEILKLPIIPVYAPNHSFVRFLFNDNTYLNWDTVNAGSYPDEFYIKKLNISDVSVKKGVYLKSMSRKEFLGVEYNNIGSYLMSARKFREAVPYFDMAIQLYPDYSSAYHNRGSAFYALRQIDSAFFDLSRANSLDPARADTHNTLGDIYFDRKQYNKALDQYTESIKLDPDYFAPYYSIGLLMKLAGKEEDAKDWFKKSEEVKKKNKP